jgi:hypothetical protein
LRDPEVVVTCGNKPHDVRGAHGTIDLLLAFRSAGIQDHFEELLDDLVADDAAFVIAIDAVGLALIVNTLSVEGGRRRRSRAVTLDPAPLSLPSNRRVATGGKSVSVILAG